MHLLVCNDDGLDAPGIAALAGSLEHLGRVTVVAPDRDHSGASNSLTLANPIRVNRAGEDRFRVAGTPTDCVHLAIAGLLEHKPDMVVSGINHGANLGDDVIYSGTVAAAMEGRSLGLPAIAISLALRSNEHPNFATAAAAATRLVGQLLEDPLPADTILNVNVPDVPLAQVGGFEVTRLGHRHPSEPCTQQLDPRGNPIYWIGPPGSEQDAGPGTDFHAVRNNRISVTPIQIDLTRYQSLEQVAGWLERLEAPWLHVGLRRMSERRGRAGIGMTSQRTRDRLVQRLRKKGIADERVLAAIGRIPRHLFVDEALASRAYEDTALPIGRGQTISQPFVVGRMTEALLEAEERQKVLEVGTGSGYQAAILAQVVESVFSVERIEELSRSARRKFREVGIRNIRAKHADGNVGWPQQAPFDAIMVTAAAAELPPALMEQVRVGGVIVAPLGQTAQQLLRITRTRSGYTRETLDQVTFVPLLQGEIR